MTRENETYNFSRELRKEREAGVDNLCEQCGEECDELQGHHIIPRYFARTNPALTPVLISSMANLAMLCPGCHEKADKVSRNLTKHEIGFVAWALFDLDPEEVRKKQGFRENKKKNKSNNQFQRKNKRNSRGKKKYKN